MPLDACFLKINDILYKHDCFILKLQCSYSTVCLNMNNNYYYQSRKHIKGMPCKSTTVCMHDLLGFLRCGLPNKSV